VETWVNEAARRGGRVLSSGLLGCGSAFGRSGAFAALWSGSPRHSFPRLCGRDAWIRTSSALGAPGTLCALKGTKLSVPVKRNKPRRTRRPAAYAHGVADAASFDSFVSVVNR
jgi:hypothetical protein